MKYFTNLVEYITPERLDDMTTTRGGHGDEGGTQSAYSDDKSEFESVVEVVPSTTPAVLMEISGCSEVTLRTCKHVSK